MDRDRAILLTPPGVGAIAVVRLIGPGVKGLLTRHFDKPLGPMRPVHGNIASASGQPVTSRSRIIDDVVIVRSDDGRSADVNLHGGAWVVRSFFELVRAGGFDVMDRASLPLDEVAVDADSGIEREVLRCLPLARTELALQALLAQPRAWEQLEQSGPAQRQAEIERMLSDRALVHLLHPPRVAIIGIPNVGKSTLANRLFAQDRSITADAPGTTRDWVGEMANIDGLIVRLVDTPGIRPTSDSIERAAIDRSAEQIRSADLVLVVLDPTQPFEPQKALMDRHPSAILIVNKSDVRERWNGPNPGLPTVATTGQGIDDLRKEILRHFQCRELDPQRPRIWTERQRGELSP